MSISNFILDDSNSFLEEESEESCAAICDPLIIDLRKGKDSIIKRKNKENVNFIKFQPDKDHQSSSQSEVTSVCDTDRPFRCGICYKNYKKIDHLKRHLLSHNGERKYKCEVCQKQFNNKHYLKQHVRLHDDPRYSCLLCDKKFPIQRYLKNHLKHAHKIYECDNCKYEFDNLQKYNDHIKAHNVVYYTCDQCTMLFCQEKSKVKHECYKTDIRKFSCSICDKSYKTFCDFSRHIEKHCNDKLYTCDVCLKGYNSKTSLNYHVKVHRDGHNFNCNKCDKTFDSRRALSVHVLYFHQEIKKRRKSQLGIKLKKNTTEEKPNYTKFVCAICNKGFRDKYNFDIHYRYHTGEKPFTCEVCDLSFVSKNDLTRHFRTHTGERRYACEKCDKRYTRLLYLKVHQNSCTAKKYDKLYTCNVCLKGYSTKPGLNYHIKVHRDGHNFNCNKCVKTFDSRRALSVHVLHFHQEIKKLRKSQLGIKFKKNTTEEKPNYTKFVCDICNKDFRLKYNFDIHYRYHTGEKPFMCEVCDLRFVSKSDLTRHFRTHTGERRFACEKCDKRYTRLSYLKVHQNSCTPPL